ncbi:transcription termination/antitermination protein NusG [Microvirga alba]|uniref:NusG-like N-terminal domain-containing protein n=1 Tax=Microvirga alba TaxID=2791025 RepID=A0A931FP66_9HYPH|nr:transcription termination/antitermination NusG family protein [Microvirga alba]MBF9234694.1 hypothetical protein [Microvirga alba]
MSFEPSSLTHRVPRTFKTKARSRPSPLARPVLNPSWYVIFTNPKCEERAQGGLEALGYATFLPMMAKWVKVPPHRAKGDKNKRERVERPLFPRYLFVGLEQGLDSFYPIRLTDGVADILNNKGAPIRVPDEIMSRMQDAYERGDHDETVKEAQRFAAKFASGQTVRMASGPFEGFTATILNASKTTIALEAEVYGRKVKIDIPAKMAIAELDAVC